MSNKTSKPVIVLGAGGHATVLIACLLRIGVDILGLLDTRKPKGKSILNVEILGGDDEIGSYHPNDILLVNGIALKEYSSARRNLSIEMRHAGFTFLTVIDRTATVFSEEQFGEGVQLMAGAVIQSSTVIGPDCIINTGALIDHHCDVGANCHICPGVTLAGNVSIGEQTLIGSGSTILPGVSVGRNCVIAAGSVVYNDIADNVTFIQRRHNVTVERLIDKQ